MNDEFLEERIEESNELQVRTTLQISNEWHRGDTFFDGSDKHENRWELPGGEKTIELHVNKRMTLKKCTSFLCRLYSIEPFPQCCFPVFKDFNFISLNKNALWMFVIEVYSH